jgi:hypothetical protein
MGLAGDGTTILTSTEVGIGRGGGAAPRQTRLTTANVIAAKAIASAAARMRARRLGPGHSTPAETRRSGSSSREVARRARACRSRRPNVGPPTPSYRR